jgi:hypothetical protein
MASADQKLEPQSALRNAAKGAEKINEEAMAVE